MSLGPGSGVTFTSGRFESATRLEPVSKSIRIWAHSVPIQFQLSEAVPREVVKLVATARPGTESVSSERTSNSQAAVTSRHSTTTTACSVNIAKTQSSAPRGGRKAAIPAPVPGIRSRPLLHPMQSL